MIGRCPPLSRLSRVLAHAPRLTASGSDDLNCEEELKLFTQVLICSSRLLFLLY